jgi:pimeloyl-ACP methyl ester carboxylesterase
MLRCLILLMIATFAGCTTLASPPDPGMATRKVTVATRHGPLTLAVTERGSGPPVLLIHGLGSTSDAWDGVVPALASRYRVLALDLRGFGQSDKPNDAHYSIADQAEAVAAFLDKDGLTGVTVVGHSLGGGVALKLSLDEAAAGRTRIKALALLDTIAYRQPLPLFFRVLQVPVVGSLGMSLVPPEMQASEALRIAYHDQTKVTDALVERYARPLRDPAVRHAFAETVNALIPDDIDTLTARYPSIALPTLILWCTNDVIVPIALGKRLASDIKTSRFAKLSDCGHMPHEERPALTSQYLDQFLGEVYKPGRVKTAR